MPSGLAHDQGTARGSKPFNRHILLSNGKKDTLSPHDIVAVIRWALHGSVLHITRDVGI
jgi:hypothetical protein